MEHTPPTLVDPHTLGATGLLLALFCAFFWLGFYAGKSSAPQNGASAVEQEKVPSQPVRWRIAAQ